MTSNQKRAIRGNIARTKKLLAGGKHWIKGVDFDGSNNYCLWGAAHAAGGIGENLAVRLLASAINPYNMIAKEYYDAAKKVIIRYNDAKGRRFRDIAAKLERVLKDLDA